MQVRWIRGAMLAVTAIATGCQAAVRSEPPDRPEIAALQAAYQTILELEKCVERAPDATDSGLSRERDRTRRLLRTADAKGLQAHLDEAAAEWRHTDSLADKICYFQYNDYAGPSARLFHGANNRLQAAIARF